MIKDVFVFKKDAWHLKLITNVWGYDHNDFKNMCPYFWLAVFTTLASPFIYAAKAIYFICLQVIKFIVPPLISISDYIDERNKRKLDEWCEQYMASILSDEEEYNKLIKMNLKTNCRYRKFLNDFLWGDDFDKLELRNKIQNDRYEYQDNTRIRVENVKREKRYVKVQKINTIKQTSAQNINSIVQAIKPATMFIMYAVGAFLGCFILFWLYLGIVWLTTVNWFNVAHVAMQIIVLILVTILAGLTGYTIIMMMKGLLKWMCRNITIPSINLSFLQFIPNFFNWLGNIIITPIKWLVNGIVTLVEIAIAFKKNNCPGLKFED